MAFSVAALIFERCLVAIGAGRVAEAEVLLRQMDLSGAGPATRALHAELWTLASNAGAADMRVGGVAPQSARVPSSSNAIRISLVTSVFNRFWQLRDTLPRNLEVIRGQADVELVVVDFGGDDSAQIRDLVEREFAFDLLSGHLKYFVATVRWTRFHMAAAKNIAHRLSQGDFVFSLDADNFFLPSDLVVVRDHIAEHGGAALHQTTGPAPMRHSSWSRYAVLSAPAEYHDEFPSWNGSSGRIGIARETFERVNGYNENLVGMGMDDIDFLIRLMKAGVVYRHNRIERPTPAVFIANSSADEAREHENNGQNWELMDEGIHAGRLAPLRAPAAAEERFHRYAPTCMDHSANARVTLFSSLCGIQDFIDRFLVDLQHITATPGVCVWLLDVVGSHPEHVSARLRAAADSPCVFYLPVHRDPGLYALWNIAIGSMASPHLGNLNADDLRGPGWLRSCLNMLESGQADVASPITVPFTDAAATSYGEVLATLRAPDARETRWFETRCIVTGDFPHEAAHHESLTDGVYGQEDLFQLMHGNKLASYCIPNASSVWSRRVHALGGHFDEDTWGTFADLALWARAGAGGARFRQVAYPALFYVSDQQAHRRQHYDETRLVQLALRHGAPGIRAWSSRRQFDLSHTGGDFGGGHPQAWSQVRDAVSRHFLHTTPRLVLDMSVERSFLGNARPHEQAPVASQPWAGFVHGTPNQNPELGHGGHSFDLLLEEPRFAASLEHCRGLITINECHRAYLARRLAERRHAIPVYLLRPPAIALAARAGPCSIDLGTPSCPTVFHVGQQPESVALFAKLRLDRSRKILLIPSGISADHFLQETVNKALSRQGLASAEEHFGHICSASPADHVHVLQRGIIFDHSQGMTDSSLVLDCIDAGARLVVNRHPAAMEHLGADYPLFYDDEAEAHAKLTLLTSSPEFQSILPPHFEAIRTQRSISRFCRELARIGEHVYDSL